MGPTAGDRLIDRLMQQRRATAGSATLSAYVGVGSCAETSIVGIPLRFYQRDAMLARVLKLWPCVCLSVRPQLSVSLSQVGVLSKWMNGLIWFLVWRLLSTSPTLCSKEIQVSGTFS